MENKICCSSFIDCDRETENKDHEVKKKYFSLFNFSQKIRMSLKIHLWIFLFKTGCLEIKLEGTLPTNVSS